MIKKSTLTKLSVIFPLYLFTSLSATKAQDSTAIQIKDSLSQRVENVENELKSQKKFKVSGYIQAQFQYGEKDASLKVGSSNENKENGFNRIGIRRGRIKFSYEEKIAAAVIQLDITEKGVQFKDAYVNLKDPWINTNAIRAGIFDRPFGYEITYSSSRRESPERSTIFQTLFPQERDLGAMLTLQPSKKSALHFIKLEAGIFAGNGIKVDTDNRKDFIGHILLDKEIGKYFQIGAGASYYYGGVYQGTANVYSMEGKQFVLNSDPSNLGKFAKREYFGYEARFGVKTNAGKTQLSGEYLFGQQPGTESSTTSPNGVLPDYDTYIRRFNGGYITLVQDIGPLPIQAIIKYDWYDPNTAIAGNEVGINGTGKADALKNTLGFGALWNATKAIRLTAYYEINKFEKTDHIASLSQLKANAFTLRLQYKF